MRRGSGTTDPWRGIRNLGRVVERKVNAALHERSGGRNWLAIAVFE